MSRWIRILKHYPEGAEDPTTTKVKAVQNPYAMKSL